jgi:hypothetical protein
MNNVLIGKNLREQFPGGCREMDAFELELKRTFGSQADRMIKIVRWESRCDRGTALAIIRLMSDEEQLHLLFDAEKLEGWSSDIQNERRAYAAAKTR